jgi:hypothetical protein
MCTVRFTITLLLSIFILSSAFAEDTTTTTTDASCYKYDPQGDAYYWDGFRCMVDQNGNGQIDDCSEMLLCSKPQSIGICSKSQDPIGYKCLSTGKIYMPLSNASGIEDINTADIIDTPLDQAQTICQEYNPQTKVGCPELKCTPIYTHTCSADNKTFISGEQCQLDCGAKCNCERPGIYDFDTQLCYIESQNPCPKDMEYDPVLNACVAYPDCPEGTTLNPDTNTCESSEVLFCPSDTIYNPETGRCQKFPDCPNGTFYFPDIDKCIVASCPNQYTYDVRSNLCIRNNDCPPYGEINPQTLMCQHNIFHCIPQYTSDELCASGVNCVIRDYITFDLNYYQGNCSYQYFNPGNTSYQSTPYNGSMSNYKLSNWLCKGIKRISVGSDKCTNRLTFARPYFCDRTNTLYDKEYCDSICPCQPGYSPQDPICVKNPCKSNEQLIVLPYDTHGVPINPPRYMCSIPPTIWGSGGQCPPGVATDGNIYYNSGSSPYQFNPQTGLCERPPHCPSSQQWQYGYNYDPQHDLCTAIGNPTCPSGYSPDSQGNCVANPICPSGTTFNPNTMRCEQQLVCNSPFTMTLINNVYRCAYSVQCPAGTDAVTLFGDYVYWYYGIRVGCFKKPSPTCIQPYQLDSVNNVCYTSIQCPQGRYKYLSYVTINGTYYYTYPTCYLAPPSSSCTQPFQYQTDSNSNFTGCYSPLICEPPGQWVSYYSCGYCFYQYTPPSDWKTRCQARGSYAYQNTGLCWKPPTCSQGTLYQYYPYYWNSTVAYICGYPAESCLPGFQDASDKCIISPPPCITGATYNTSTHRCEMNMLLQCPEGFNNESNSYCWTDPICPSGTVYSSELKKCITGGVSATCPVQGLPCDSSNTCTQTVQCNIELVQINITHSPGDALALQIYSFTQGSTNTVIFTQSSGAKVTVNFGNCTITEATGNNLQSVTSVSISNNRLSFYSGSTEIGHITFSDCTPSISTDNINAIYGPYANGTNTLSFYSFQLTLTTNRTISICPLDSTLQCDSQNTCSKTYQCQIQCPSGTTFDQSSGNCVANPVCTGGAVWTPSLNRCVLNVLDPSSYYCPSGYTANPNLRICYGNPDCPPPSTFDWYNNRCAYDKCPYPMQIVWINYTPYCHNPSWVQCNFLDDELYGRVLPLNYCGYVPADFGFTCTSGYQFNTTLGSILIDNCYQYTGSIGCIGGYQSGARHCPQFPADAEMIISNQYTCKYSPHFDCPQNWIRVYYNQSPWIDGCLSPPISINNFSTYCPSTPDYPKKQYGLNTWYGTCSYIPQLQDLNCPADFSPTYYKKDDPNYISYSDFCYDSSYGTCVSWGLTYPTTAPQCVRLLGRNECPSGTINTTGDSNQRLMYCLNNQTCPYNTSYDASSQVCYAQATCPSGGSLDPVLRTCKANATAFTCPTGYVYNPGLQRCTAMPYCRDAINTAGNRLTATYSSFRDICFVCPEGFQWNDQLQTCVAEPSCPEGMVLNTQLDVCESVMQLLCSSGAMYDPQTGKCKAAPKCPSGYCTVNQQDGCYNTQTQKCDTSISPPCNVDMYNTTLKLCVVPGSPECPQPYIFNPDKMRCEYSPECPPTDWVCPAEADDPICGNNSPFVMKTYITDNTNNTSETAALTISKVNYQTYTQIASLGYMPEYTRMNDIFTHFGYGPFWVKDGILYKDAYFMITNISQGLCYSVVPFNIEEGSGIYWRPKGITSNSCPTPIGNPEVFYHWEKVKDTCLCLKYKTEAYNLVCTNNTTGAYTEQLASTTYQNNTTYQDQCVYDSQHDIYTCPTGVQGLEECSLNKVTYSQETQPCGGVQIPRTKSVVTCAESKPAYSLLETRDIEHFNRGVVWWNQLICNPCVSYSSDIIETPETNTNEEIPPGVNCATNIKVFSGFSKRCRSSGIETIFTNCCSMSGWFTSWCKAEEKELKKRKESRTCHEVGEYCSKKISLGFTKICVQKKKSYCCFSSKLARIIQEQGRPMLPKSWGSAESPDCSGFLPEELSRIDFSRIDFSEYISDIQNQALQGTSNAQQKAIEGITNWLQEGAQNQSLSNSQSQ